MTNEEFIVKWLNMKYLTYNKLEHKGSVYLYYDNMDYADIRIDRNQGVIYYEWTFWLEFQSISNIKLRLFKLVMRDWATNVFKLQGAISFYALDKEGYDLKIPIKYKI